MSTDTDTDTVKEDIPQQNVDQAIEQAAATDSHYRIEGYGRSDDGYGGPYHPDAFLDPNVQFALSGAPEAQAKYDKELHKLDKGKHKNRKGVSHDKVDLVAASAHSTVVESAEYRAAHATPELEATADNIKEAAARKHLIVPKSNETTEDVNNRAFDAVEPKEPTANKQAAKEAEKTSTQANKDITGQSKAAKKSESKPAKKTAAKKTTTSSQPAKKATFK